MDSNLVIGITFTALVAIGGGAFMFYRFATMWTKNALAPVKGDLDRVEAELKNMEASINGCVSSAGLDNSLDALGLNFETNFVSMREAINEAKKSIKDHAKDLYDKHDDQTSEVAKLSSRVAVVEDRTKKS